MLKFKAVSCMEGSKGEVTKDLIEFKTLESAMEMAEIEEQHIKQEYIPGSMGIDLHPIDTHTKKVLNEHWLKLLYTNQLHREDQDA